MGNAGVRAACPLKLPAAIKDAAAGLAKEDGVPLNQRISVAIAQEIGAVETAAEFLRQCAGSAKPADMLPFLDRAAADSLPAGEGIESDRR